MTLTAEQQEQIRQNRERALAIQKERAKQREATKRERTSEENQESPTKKIKDNTVKKPNDKVSSNTNDPTEIQHKQQHDDDKTVDGELEDFEIGASEFVTRQDAMKLYCLPAGTLDVCQYVERPNPRNSSWKPMRLYHRSEIRQRAHKRFGGLDGLVQERQNRADKRLSVDMEKAKQLFR